MDRDSPRRVQPQSGAGMSGEPIAVSAVNIDLPQGGVFTPTDEGMVFAWQALRGITLDEARLEVERWFEAHDKSVLIKHEKDGVKPLPSGVKALGELRDTGLLWFINRVVFHPRGYALALYFDSTTDPAHMKPMGWTLLGDGSEPWTFEAPEDESFRAVEAFFAMTRGEQA